MITKHPLPEKAPGRWHFYFRRQIGEYLVRFEWIREVYSVKNALDYTIEYYDKSGQLLHTEFGQHTPEW